MAYKIQALKEAHPMSPGKLIALLDQDGFCDSFHTDSASVYQRLEALKAQAQTDLIEAQDALNEAENQVAQLQEDVEVSEQAISVEDLL